MKLVVTFHTTADAMAMERHVKRIIHRAESSVPRAISAGCGLSWCAALDEREEIVAMMEKVGIEPEDLHECLV